MSSTESDSSDAAYLSCSSETGCDLQNVEDEVIQHRGEILGSTAGMQEDVALLKRHHRLIARSLFVDIEQQRVPRDTVNKLLAVLRNVPQQHIQPVLSQLAIMTGQHRQTHAQVGETGRDNISVSENLLSKEAVLTAMRDHPLEMFELVLMKTFIALCDDRQKLQYTMPEATRMTYCTLAAVCYNWWKTINGWSQSTTKHWFKHRLAFYKTIWPRRGPQIGKSRPETEFDKTEDSSNDMRQEIGNKEALHVQMEEMKLRMEAFGDDKNISTINESKLRHQLDVALEAIASLRTQLLLVKSYSLSTPVTASTAVEGEGIAQETDNIVSTLISVSCLPLELLELLLIKSSVKLFIIYFDHEAKTESDKVRRLHAVNYKSRLTLAIKLTYATLSAVCYNWWQTMRGWSDSPTRQWLKVKHQVQRHIARYERSNVWLHINSIRDTLVDIIEPDYGLLEKLAKLRVLSRDKCDTIRNKKTLYERNDCLLEFVLESITNDESDEKFYMFLVALENNEQKHVVNFIEHGDRKSDHDSRPLGRTELQSLQANFQFLADKMQVNDAFVSDLGARRCITNTQRDVLLEKQTSANIINVLMDIMTRRSVDDYNKFDRYLSDNDQSRVAIQFSSHADNMPNMDFLAVVGDNLDFLLRCLVVPHRLLLRLESLDFFRYKIPEVPRTFEKVFEGKRAHMIDKLSVSTRLLNSLEDHKVMTSEQRSRVNDVEPESKKIEKLMDLLKRADERKVPIFFQVLVHDGQRHIVELLLGRLVDDCEFLQPTENIVKSLGARTEMSSLKNKNRIPMRQHKTAESPSKDNIEAAKFKMENNEKQMDELEGADDRKVDAFFQDLIADGQRHIVKLPLARPTGEFLPPTTNIERSFKRILRMTYDLLSLCLVLSDALLIDHKTVDYIRDKVPQIRRQSTTDMKFGELLNILDGVPAKEEESVYIAFLAALRQDGHEHVANIIDDTRPMSD